MQELEKIKGTDSVAEGLMKADRNFTKLKLEVANIDVSEQIETHNTSDTSHVDIRNLISNIDVSGQINVGIESHNANELSHPHLIQQLNDIVSSKANKKWEDVIPLTLKNGWTGECSIRKHNDLGLIEIYGVITSPEVITNYQSPFTLPVGYKPVTTVSLLFRKPNSHQNITVELLSAGYAQINHPSGLEVSTIYTFYTVYRGGF